MAWSRREFETARKGYSGSVSGNPIMDNDDVILQLLQHYFKTHATYKSKRSPLIIRYRLEELLPRRGLRKFVNRHLDEFEWISEEQCNFALKESVSKKPDVVSKQGQKPSLNLAPPPELEHLVYIRPPPGLGHLGERRPLPWASAPPGLENLVERRPPPWMYAAKLW